jgi:hypothetical protein
MKRMGGPVFFWFAALLVLLLLLPAGQAAGVELNALFDLGNLGFDRERSATDDGYTGREWYWQGSVEVNHGFSERTAIKAGLYRDTVLRNVAYALLYYNLDFLSMGIGTIQGLNNTDSTILKPGIASSVQLSFPGVMFARLLSDYSLGGLLEGETGDYQQSRNELALGFYARNAICSLTLQSKKFAEHQTDTLDVVDSLLRYAFTADIYKKNFPFRLLFSFAYQSLQKKFLDETAGSTVHTLNSLMAGLELDVDVTRYLTFMLGLDSAVLSFGDDYLAGLSNPAPGGYLFRGQTGFTLKFDNLKSRRLALSEQP